MTFRSGRTLVVTNTESKSPSNQCKTIGIPHLNSTTVKGLWINKKKIKVQFLCPMSKATTITMWMKLCKKEVNTTLSLNSKTAASVSQRILLVSKFNQTKYFKQKRSRSSTNHAKQTWKKTCHRNPNHSLYHTRRSKINP